jgi:hypothetical protein
MLNKDAFSSGQIGSKLWLCEELEKIINSVDTIWIYGGWYGLTGFLLSSRNNIQIKEIRSIDIDPACEEIADMINENWKWQQWKFKAVTMNCNKIVPTGIDLIINTSTEHFENMDWWNNIPTGTFVVLQGNNMPHEDHVIHSTTLDSFINQYPLTTYYFKGSKEFKYPEWEFTRYMVIGIK